MVRDKDHRGFLRALLPRVRHVVFTQAACERALPAGELKELAPPGAGGRTAERRGRGRVGTRSGARALTWEVVPGVTEAVEAALSSAGNDELVCVTGSFYTVGEAMQCLGIGVKENI
jgi:folylpolyglutamate synthase/dihydropteroate synthase